MNSVDITDYRVTVGDGVCHVQSVSPSYVTCLPPEVVPNVTEGNCRDTNDSRRLRVLVVHIGVRNILIYVSDFGEFTNA